MIHVHRPIVEELRDKLTPVRAAVDRIVAVHRWNLANGDARCSREIALLLQRRAEAEARLDALEVADQGTERSARAKAEQALAVLHDACWYVSECLGGNTAPARLERPYRIERRSHARS